MTQGNRRHIPFILLWLAVLAGCQTPGLQAPAINVPADQAVVWHDLLSPDTAKSKDFMRNVLGWQLEDAGAYTLIRNQHGTLLGGMIDTQAMDWPMTSGGWLISLQTPDLATALERIRQQDGKVLQPERPFPGRGPSALIQDPEGAVFELVQLAASEDAETTDDRTWVWHELITRNSDTTASWYADTFDLTSSDMKSGRQILQKGDRKIATVSKNPFQDVRNQWIPVVAVSDFTKTLPKVVHWGGRIAVAPTPEIANGQLALIQDPTGAALILQEQE